MSNKSYSVFRPIAVYISLLLVESTVFLNFCIVDLILLSKSSLNFASF